MPESTIKRDNYIRHLTLHSGLVQSHSHFLLHLMHNWPQWPHSWTAAFKHVALFGALIPGKGQKIYWLHCYFEWYWNASWLIVRFIFLFKKTEITDAFSEKTKKKWCLIEKDLSVVNEKFASINQKHYQDLSSVASSKWNFSARFPSQTSFCGENIDCFLRTFQAMFTRDV